MKKMPAAGLRGNVGVSIQTREMIVFATILYEKSYLGGIEGIFEKIAYA